MLYAVTRELRMDTWSFESSPVRPVQRPVLNCLAEMAWFDVSSATEVRDRARYLQDAVVRPRGEAEPGDCVFQQFLAFGCNRAMFADHFRHHLRVRVCRLFFLKPLELFISRGDHPLPPGRGGLGR